MLTVLAVMMTHIQMSIVLVTFTWSDLNYVNSFSKRLANHRHSLSILPNPSAGVGFSVS